MKNIKSILEYIDEALNQYTLFDIVERVKVDHKKSSFTIYTSDGEEFEFSYKIKEE